MIAEIFSIANPQNIVNISYDSNVFRPKSFFLWGLEADIKGCYEHKNQVLNVKKFVSWNEISSHLFYWSNTYI